MSEFSRINEIPETTNTTDFRIQSFDSVNLLLTGSFDFSYYHEVEVKFHEVSFISLPADFSHPHFRRADKAEIASIRKIVVLESKDIVFCIEAETSGSLDRLPFYVVAEKMTVTEGTVYYYEPETLKAGERISSWAKGSS